MAIGKETTIFGFGCGKKDAEVGERFYFEPGDRLPFEAPTSPIIQGVIEIVSSGTLRRDTWVRVSDKPADFEFIAGDKINGLSIRGEIPGVATRFTWRA